MRDDNRIVKLKGEKEKWHIVRIVDRKYRRVPDEAYEDEVPTVRGGNGIQ